MRKKSKTPFLDVAALVMFAISLLLVTYSVPFMRLSAMKLLGRSECSWSRTLGAFDEFDRLAAARDRIQRTSQVLVREDGLQLLSVPGQGQFWIPDPPHAFFSLVLAEQQMDVYGQTDWRVRSGDIVLDCGADYGSFTRRALNAGAKLVVAIEIAAPKERCLRRTFAKEIAGGRVVVVAKGVWDRADTLLLDDDSVVLFRGERKVAAPVTTIDEIVNDLKLPKVDFIKMDIEGAEERALTGASQTLKRFFPRMAIATEHARYQSRQVKELIGRLAPAYRSACGSCLYTSEFLYPDVTFFAAPRP